MTDRNENPKDEKLCAIIMAAIAAFNQPEESSEVSNQYIVRSIRRKPWISTILK